MLDVMKCSSEDKRKDQVNSFSLQISFALNPAPMPALKCPYLAQFNLQQIRASASYLLSTGAQACPVFGPMARRMSTTMNVEEIKAVHQNVLGRTAANKIKIPTSTGESKERIYCAVRI